MFVFAYNLQINFNRKTFCAIILRYRVFNYITFKINNSVYDLFYYSAEARQSHTIHFDAAPL